MHNSQPVPLAPVYDYYGTSGIGVNKKHWARSGFGMINGILFGDDYDDCGDCQLAYCYDYITHESNFKDYNIRLYVVGKHMLTCY